MHASLYQPLFLGITATLSYLTAFRLAASPDYRFQQQKSNYFFPLLLSLIFVFWIGGRPVSGRYFGDTANYALGYYGYDVSTYTFRLDLQSEWAWDVIMVLCKGLGMSVHGFFIIVEAGYILSVMWAVKRFFPTNPMLGMLFVWTSLMFFTFGTNGLRNGLACHLILLAMSFFFDEKYFVGGIICLIAMGIHRSVALPIATMFAGRFLIKDVRYAIFFWIMAIFVSLAIGNAAADFFALLDFDSRMSVYNTTEYASSFSHAGFRWDFLLYSSFPVFMAWYTCVRKKIKDDWFQALSVSYCLCNAFWILVMRSAFSNRFAYLSWFMYPIVIAYPLINMPVWQDQDRKIALILAAYCGFTLFMQFAIWG